MEGGRVRSSRGTTATTALRSISLLPLELLKNEVADLVERVWDLVEMEKARKLGQIDQRVVVAPIPAADPLLRDALEAMAADAPVAEVGERFKTIEDLHHAGVPLAGGRLSGVEVI